MLPRQALVAGKEHVRKDEVTILFMKTWKLAINPDYYLDYVKKKTAVVTDAAQA